ncbi:MAG: tRNA threonylcarbamoyladenosine dehydratase [Muribaculaceae bacterium]|nr:tRNA threonylcarbamoyladenosine dehydratase [Muribaculaceae bacterium]
MLEQFSRTELLLGAEAMEKLERAHVAVFGIGGVGGYVVEALARSGIGHFDLIDNDKVCMTNLNRQIIATLDTIGRYKVQVMKERILSINPEAGVNVHQCFYLPENAASFDFKQYSYVIDAVDTVTAKIELVLRAKEAGVPIISCMGTGNKINPAMLEIGDIYQTSVCPLAKVMRRELRRRNVDALKVLYSQEEPIKPTGETKEQSPRRAIPGSTSFVPPTAGLLIASEVVKDLLKYFPLLPHTV